MEVSDIDRLIVNSEMFLLLRQCVQKNTSSDEIIAKLKEVFHKGADINACDKNDNNNTVLHIAAVKGDKDVFLYLIQQGANLIRNAQNKTALDLVSQKNPALGKELSEITSLNEKPVANIAKENTSNHEARLKQNQNKAITPSKTPSVQEKKYAKRSGTSGVSGQFYETKLLSLVLHRALHDQEIENFYLAANINDIGDFDDVCFRYGNVACFMQTKHRENIQKAKLRVDQVRSTTGKLGLGVYFESFLKIKQRFSPEENDPMFHGKFEDIDTYFIFYTPSQEEFERKLSADKKMCSKLHDIIYTSQKQIKEGINSGDVFQFDYEDRDLDFLTTFIKNKELKILGSEFLKFILSNKNVQDIWKIPLIKMYHPALAQKVISISEGLETPHCSGYINNLNGQNVLGKSNSTNNCLTGRFRTEFFDSEDSNLILLKEIFFQEIVFTHSPKTRLSTTELKQAIQDIANNPCPETISVIIGSPIKFDENTDKLSLDEKKLPSSKSNENQEIKYELQKIQVTRTMVKHAVHLAGHQKLKNLIFPLSPAFGNTDLKTNRKTKQKEQDRLNFLVEKFDLLIKHFADRNKNKKVKTIDLSCDVVGPHKILELSHLDSNGGIGGAVGNLLKFDTKNKVLKFNTRGVLRENARYMLNKLKEKTGEDMTNYEINVLIEGFPRDTFDTYSYDHNVAAQFLSKLWFYTGQAQEDIVENTLKKEINIHYNADKQLFHVHSDAIFLRFHDEIQKWWKKQNNAFYITEKSTIYDNAKKDIVDNPLLTVLNVMFIRKVKAIGVDFSDDVIETLDLDEYLGKGKNQILNIVSDAVVLSAAKIMQRKNCTNNYSFVNLDYVNSLPDDDRKMMVDELKLVKDMTLVLISETTLEHSLRDTLFDILHHFQNVDPTKKQIVVITDKPFEINQADKLKVNDYNLVYIKDNNVSFLDLTSDSQTVLLEKYAITYQGQEVKLKVLLENSKELINGKLLWSLLNKEKVEVGETLYTHQYNEIKSYYINRNLKRNDTEYVVGTLYDIEDTTVLIASQPCMGKTTLLTHLSLETKNINPTTWIVHINLSIDDNNITKLKYNDDMNAIMVFLCKATLKNFDELAKGSFTNVDNGEITFNLYNSNNAEDISFELQLFIHCFNTDNIIFLFDGFDKIYPQNTDEAFKIFNAIEQANKRMWITSDSYAVKVLEDKFGTAYKLGRLSTVQQKSFLERFWSTNIQLEKLNHLQFNNITLLINYIRRTFNCCSLENENDDNRSVVPVLSVPLHIVYLTLLEYFKNDAHSLSAVYLREIIKKKWRLNSFTNLDRYLRTSDSNNSLPLTGTPLHMYIAANYFKFQVTDKFDLNVNTNIIQERSGIYLDAITLYRQFLNVNIKNLCEIENKSVAGMHQQKIRDDFFESHKKLALYAVFKESDIGSILTESEIREVKKTMQLIKSGELKTQPIDSVLDTPIPRFYHFLFLEYFAVEAVSDLIKQAKQGNLEQSVLESFWNLVVNGVLLASPASLRNMFEYKLKYDPELAEAASDDNSKRIVFNLLLKPDQAGTARTFDKENALNIALNEGLVNVTNFLLKCVRSKINNDKLETFVEIFKSSASILEAADTSRSILSENVLQSMKNIDGKTLMMALNSNVVGISLQERIKERIREPVKRFTEQLIEGSRRNDNLGTLLEELPYHLPEFVRQFNKK